MSDLFDILGGRAKSKIMRFFVNRPVRILYKNELARECGISPTATASALKELLKEKAVIETKVSYFRGYQLNQKTWTKLISPFKEKLSGGD